MSTQQSSRKLALGLFVVCILALVVGLINTAQLDSHKTKSSDEQTGKSLLGGKPHLALLELSGPISMEPGKEGGIFQSDSNAVTVRKALDKVVKDDSVKGVLLRINSPGGTVAMSQELNAAVRRVSKKKPVVVSMGDLTASGGYYTACAADRIVVNPGTLTASIGVIISTVEFSDLMNNKLGVHGVTVKSGKFKDLLSPYRKPRPEELSLIQTIIDDSYQDFLNTVLEGRTRFITDPAKKAEISKKIRAVADGRVVTGRQAVVVGLADELGDQEHAYAVLDAMAKKRFSGLKGKERLPLESVENGFDLLEFVGLKMDTFLRGSIPDPIQQAAKMVPFSMRYPNQPLWVLE